VRLDNLVKFQKARPGRDQAPQPPVCRLHLRQPGGTATRCATDAVNRIARETLPPGYSIAYTGQAEEFAKTGGYVIFAFGMALIMIYMVLASPVQLAAATAGGHDRPAARHHRRRAALWLFGETLNMFSMIGMILLMGLVARTRFCSSI